MGAFPNSLASIIIKYRIVVLAEDNTEAFNIVLLDRAVKRMIGKTTTKLIAEGFNVHSIHLIYMSYCHVTYIDIY